MRNGSTTAMSAQRCRAPGAPNTHASLKLLGLLGMEAWPSLSCRNPRARTACMARTPGLTVGVGSPLVGTGQRWQSCPALHQPREAGTDSGRSGGENSAHRPWSDPSSHPQEQTLPSPGHSPAQRPWTHSRDNTSRQFQSAPGTAPRELMGSPPTRTRGPEPGWQQDAAG